MRQIEITIHERKKTIMEYIYVVDVPEDETDDFLEYIEKNPHLAYDKVSNYKKKMSGYKKYNVDAYDSPSEKEITIHHIEIK